MQGRAIFEQLVKFILDSEMKKGPQNVFSLKMKMLKLLAKEVDKNNWKNLFILYKNDEKIDRHCQSIAILRLYGPNGIDCIAYNEHIYAIWNKAILINIAATIKED